MPSDVASILARLLRGEIQPDDFVELLIVDKISGDPSLTIELSDGTEFLVKVERPWVQRGLG